MKVTVEMTEEQRQWIYTRIIDWFEWVEPETRVMQLPDKEVTELSYQLDAAKIKPECFD